MILETLYNLVEDLKSRIEVHGAQLRSKEMQTRYALIDPLLRELGWDTSDPSLVTPEIPTSGGRADYALLRDGKPVVMVEAKRLGEDLKGAVSQGVQYCLERGTQHFAVTDGQRWEVYETHRPVPIEQKKVVSFDVVGDSAGTVCLEALALWRPSVEAGNVRGGREPVVGRPDESDEPLQSPEPEWGPEWKPFDVSSMTKDEGGRYIRPVGVAFPDESSVEVKYGRDVTASVTKYLWEKGYLTESNCPIQVAKGNRYVIATSPVHASGAQMRKPKLVVGTLYMEAGFSVHRHVRNAKSVIEHVGRDPAQFRLRFP